MAQRVATEYKKMVLKLNPAELQSFIDLFQAAEFQTEIRIYENGETEIVLTDKETKVPLSFKRMGNLYTFDGTCTISDMKLANQMRMAVKKFKGTGVAHRFYPTYTMIYYYGAGNVMKIVERRGTEDKVVYQFKDTAGELQRLFERCGVEDEISWVRFYIDQLLDMRNERYHMSLPTEEIDRQLNKLSHQLFVLEA
ncbi:non-ribosomal peptide synthetase module [Aneurinibacillus sp. Ricciae_BoGa-3]|uniref:non-ribosomal peptide synthetase module n=1 Tax=Aneurinibacillus sp. Ricciae_BoGa-3 TaxID=3022697 RepID=UPI0023424D8D|nr:non-ribosomal peptide synthetase module [Aneurinibacillus sp. Ricciae_BoGa-3]WCK52482.1 non-ribosomal peptide synthetase module [Aneurinibacillus sp. Ricciae_BoGa-3]